METMKPIFPSKSTSSDLKSSSISPLTFSDVHSDPVKNFGSMSMEDLFKNIYPDALSTETFSSVASSVDGGVTMLSRNVVNRTADEVWKDIVSGASDRTPIGVSGNGMMGEMTLEEFIDRSVALRNDESKDPLMSGFEGFCDCNGAQYQHQMFDEPILGFRNEIERRTLGNEGGRGGKGKKRAAEEPMDKATEQKQKRMIKNRESAARSRERKQARVDELEILVAELKQENEELQEQYVKEKKEWLKQIMEGLITVNEEPKPPHVLRRTNSTQW